MVVDVTRGHRGDADLPPGPARDLVDLLRRLRRRQGLSVGQIATRSGFSRGHVSEVLRGWKTPSPQTAVAITQALGASEGEAAKAHHWAEQARELQHYQRTHRLPASHSSPVNTTSPLNDVPAGASRDEPLAGIQSQALAVVQAPGRAELRPQAGPGPDAGASSAAEVPRQLPAAVAGFTGRAAELRTLTQVLDQVGCERRGRW